MSKTDTTELIRIALDAGNVAAQQPDADPELKSAYAALQQLLQDRITSSDTVTDDDPLAVDDELWQAYQTLLSALASQPPDVVGVDLEDITARSARINDVRSSGTAVRIRRAKIREALEIYGARAGNVDENGNGRDNIVDAHMA